jgi:hypothetical protein
MHENDSHFYAIRTDDELAAMSQWLNRHLEDLRRQQAAIESELRMRAENQSSRPPMVTPWSDPRPQITLQYHNPETVFAHEGQTGDPYADESRAYGLRIGAVACVVGVVFLVLLFVMASIR